MVDQETEVRSELGRVGRLVANVLAGAVVLGVACYWGAEGTKAARAWATGAAAAAGMLFGALAFCLEAFLRRVTRSLWHRSAWRSLRQRFSSDPELPREPVVVALALSGAALLGVLVFAQALTLLIERLRKIQSTALQERLTTIGAVLALLVASALAVFGFSLIRRGLSRLDRLRPLPWPHHVGLRALVWAGLPLGLVALLALRELGKVLGPVALPLYVMLFVAARIALGALLDTRLMGFARLGPALVVLAVLVSSGSTHAILAKVPEATYALDSSTIPGLSLRVLRQLSDVDRDGVSSAFGGKDCKPFDRAVHPGARDLPGNGVDEDCDGHDASAASGMPTGPRYLSDVPATDPPDIVWFVVDALRADHTTVHGYGRPTTPYLAELAQTSLVFEDARSQSSATMLSFPSMLTGVDPGRLNWQLENGKLQVHRDQQLLSERLGQIGYQTGFVASDYFRTRLPGLLQGWSWVDYLPSGQKTSSARAAALAARFIAQAQEGKKPYFLVVYMPAPHAPYVAHDHNYPNMGSGQTALYDSEIANADRYLGFVIDLLREDKARFKKTVVIVTGDHGEEFGEHGGKEHARTCHVESLHVPLLVRLPGVKAARVKRPVTLLDLVPTLLELSGAPRPAEPLLDGHSLLLSANDSPELPLDRPRFCSVVSQKAAQGDFFRRSVSSGKWTLHKELRGEAPLRLYDSEADPGEKSPVSLEGDNAAIAERLDGYLGQQMTGNLASVPLTEE